MFPQLGAFQLEVPLGRGGMGEVWRARHVLHGTMVAVKLLGAVPRGSAATAGSGPAAELVGEVRAIAALDHPNVLRVYDFGIAEDAVGTAPPGSPWMAMELATGSVEGAPPATWAELRAVLLDALAGLAHAHAHGVIHRDVKPANLLWRDGVKLADFGLAWRLDPGREAADERARGTPAFMAPEQFRGRWRDHGPWTDVYAIGCSAWLLATGLPPFSDGDWTTLARAHAYSALPAFSGGMPVPAGFPGWLARCLAKSPRERFGFAADVAFALRELGEACGEARAPVRIGAAATFQDLDGDVDLEGVLPEETLCDVRPPAIGPLPLATRSAHDLHLRGAGIGLFDLRSLPMIGRRDELGALWEALRAVHADGRPRVAVVRGAPGLGKSRLIRAFAALAHAEGVAHVLSAGFGRVPDRRDGLPRLLSGWFVTEGCEDAERLARTREGAAERDVAALVALQGGSPPPGGPSERWRVVQRLLAGLDRPSVVTLDDAQWGPDAVAFARDLLAAGSAPVLLVLGARDDDALDGLIGDPDLRLGPLSEGDRRALVRELLQLDEGLAGVVVERTGGHPLFAVALVAHWVHTGRLVRDALGYRLAPGARPEAPVGMADLLSERLLTVLPAELRDGARLASVLGEAFPLERFLALAEGLGISQPRRALRVLEAAGLGGARSRGDWGFAHALVRESLAVQARSEGTWAAWNAAAAEGADPARRGLHLVEAGRPEEAVQPLIEAATAARGDGDVARALRLLAAVDDALDAAKVGLDDPRRATTWIERSGSYVYRAAMREATDCLRRAEAILRRAGDDARLGECLLSLGHTARFVGEDPKPLLDEAIARLGPSRPADAARARATLGSHLIVNGRREEAVVELTLAVEELDRLGSERFIGTALFWLGNVLSYLGRAGEAAPRHERALDVWRRAGNRAGVLHALVAVVEDYADQGRGAEARAWLPEIAAIAEVVGAPSGTGSYAVARARVAEAEGDFVEAAAAFAEAAAEWVGQPEYALGLRARRALVLAGAGDDGVASEALADVLAEPGGAAAIDNAAERARPDLVEALRRLRG